MVNETRLVDLFCDLVKIDSVSLEERDLADAVSLILQNIGFTVEEDQAGQAIGGNCNNLYARLDGSTDQAPLLFAVHLDTVEPGRGKLARIDDDRVIRSAGNTVLGADNLAGLVPIIEAICGLADEGTRHRPIELFLSVAEELHLTGSHAMEAERLSASQAYILDTSGSPGLAVLKAPGHIALSFDVYGQAAHAGIDPENGVSAIQAASRGIAAMQLGRVDEQSTANIGRIEGGGETNVVADFCRVTAECRSLNLDRLDEIAQDMTDAMLRAADQTGAKVETTRKPSYLPYEIRPDHPVVRRFEKACHNNNLPVRLVSTGGGSDNNILALHGIDGIVISCGMTDVHSRDESVSIDDLVTVTRLVRSLILLD